MYQWVDMVWHLVVKVWHVMYTTCHPRVISSLLMPHVSNSCNALYLQSGSRRDGWVALVWECRYM